MEINVGLAVGTAIAEFSPVFEAIWPIVVPYIAFSWQRTSADCACEMISMIEFTQAM
jgi:hypothetical protein